MNNTAKESASSWWQDFSRKHPLLMFFILMVAAFVMCPLMLAASHMTAVLYKDF